MAQGATTLKLVEAKGVHRNDDAIRTEIDVSENALVPGTPLA